MKSFFTPLNPSFPVVVYAEIPVLLIFKIKRTFYYPLRTLLSQYGWIIEVKLWTFLSHPQLTIVMSQTVLIMQLLIY